MNTPRKTGRWGTAVLWLAAGVVGFGCDDPAGVDHAGEPVAALEVSAVTDAIEAGATLQIRADAYCAHGLLMETPFTWHVEPAQLATIDGVRADYEDGWVLVRASNTTPSVVIRFEASDDQALQRIQSAFRESITAVDSSIELPF